MTRTVLAFTCAATFAVAGVAAQQPAQPQQPTTPQYPERQQTQPQQQQQEQQRQAQPGTMQRQVTLTGCVYQASDQPTVFALQRTADGSQTAGGMQPGQAGTPGAPAGTTGAGTTGAGTPGAGTTGAAGTTGTGSTMGRGAAGTGASDVGAWFQLSPEASQDLKQYVGRAVRVTGTLTPGKDEKGADIVVHRLSPTATAVTAIDLKPAPRLRIQQVTATEGRCEMGQPQGQQQQRQQ